ncbi:MAG: hypothetical protein EOO63_08205 [Hymenobacter sp.]|nr:MAG: hypothetical protein EOO63_08205 [Hymenobacter sp.]
MKKALFTLLLAAAVASSWAFYPKAQEPTASYMMIIGSAKLAGFSYEADVITIAPDGSQQVQDIDLKTGSARKLTASLAELRKAELSQVNRMNSQGWHLVSVAPNNVGGDRGMISQMVYVLEKR